MYKKILQVSWLAGTLCVMQIYGSDNNISDQDAVDLANERSIVMPKTILIWDNDGTIQGSANPNDTSSRAKIVLPNVQRLMETNDVLNIICSGCKTPESELQNFDPLSIIERFKLLMNQLPVAIATFSPAIGGTHCYVLIKQSLNNDFEVRKAHEDPRYNHLIGQFKKPGTGMLVVIQDLLQELDYAHGSTKLFFIGDTWHDEHAAMAVGIPFIRAQHIHALPENVRIDASNTIKTQINKQE